ncbi:MAG: hypothetical protein GC157_11970 [Frankiales bacterium]|nr:hypothetical protein [Frankiales bacterium]
MHHIPEQVADEHRRLLLTEVPLGRLRRAAAAARRAERAQRRADLARLDAERALAAATGPAGVTR